MVIIINHACPGLGSRTPLSDNGDPELALRERFSSSELYQVKLKSWRILYLEDTSELVGVEGHPATKNSLQYPIAMGE